MRDKKQHMAQVVNRHLQGKPTRTILFFAQKISLCDANPLSCGSPVGRYPVQKEVPNRCKKINNQSKKGKDPIP